MNQTERLYKILQLLENDKAVPLNVFMERLDVSRATFKRDLEHLRSRLNAPVIFDRFSGGYRLEKGKAASRAGPKRELPGLWFTAEETYALLTMLQLLKDLEPGLLEGQVEPLKVKLRAMLGIGEHPADEVEKRVRIVRTGVRSMQPEHFERIAKAVLSGRQVVIRYFTRGTGKESERTISPQRLTHYRGNWYVDAWCHLREGLRSFSIDAILDADVLTEKVKRTGEKELREWLDSSYGIFRGKATQIAKLRFSPERARWVAHEEWHPDQLGAFEQDGSYLLEFPFHNDTELVMDILRHGADVAVVTPVTLQKVVKSAIVAMAEVYGINRKNEVISISSLTPNS